MNTSSKALPSLNMRRHLRAVALFAILFTVYFLTYTGEPISTDELLMFDGAHSLVHGRGVELAYTNSYRPYRTPRSASDGPVQLLDIEPMQSYTAAPLVWLAERLPGIGVLQMAWLLNLIMTALTGVVIYYYAVALGYSETTGITTAIMFGLCTYTWVYTRLFFREPTFTLLILFCAYCLERWRQRFEAGQFTVVWIVFALATLGLALLSKTTSLLVAPMLILVVLPDALRRLFNWRVLLVVLGLVALAVVLLLVFRQVTVSGKYSLPQLSSLDFSYLSVALPAYLISPGFSIWAFSPVLLIGLIGLVIMLRNKRYRYVLVPLTYLLSLVVGYSILQAENWYGGTGWGPRYLLPSVPFLALWLLPICEAILARRWKAWSTAAAIGIIALSFFLQAMASFGPITEFSTYLDFSSKQINRIIVAWQDGVWNPLYNPFFVVAHQITTPSPSAWLINNTGWLVLPLCGLVLLIAMIAISRITLTVRRGTMLASAVIISLTVMIGVSLRSYYRDPRLNGTANDKAWEVVDRLNKEARAGDAIFLNDFYYGRFFMNTYKGDVPLYILPDAPGERLGNNSRPETITANLDFQAHAFNAIIFPRLAPTTKRWWFVTEFGPYSEGHYRPTENYLVRHYFPMEEAVNDQAIRLLTFAPIPAPLDTITAWPEYSVNADFGAATLVGYDLPSGETYSAGATVALSLLWTQQGWPSDLVPFDYSVNVTLLSADSVTVKQRVGVPVGGFLPMSQWIKGGYYRDNYAFELPHNLPAGDYQLWVLLNDWSKNTNLSIRNNPTGNAGDHLVLATIHVQP
jgi:hypothetical protein